MGRRRTTKEIPASAPVAPVGLPEQRSGVNLWAILSEPSTAAEEIAAGKHDECLEALEHIAKSQSVVDVYSACVERRQLLTGG